MNKFDLSYKILIEEGHDLLVAENLIETAKCLENQELVHCTQEDGGIRTHFNLEGIDAWMRNRLNELHVD
jgi:hypothetical protein